MSLDVTFKPYLYNNLWAQFPCRAFRVKHPQLMQEDVIPQITKKEKPVKLGQIGKEWAGKRIDMPTQRLSFMIHPNEMQAYPI